MKKETKFWAVIIIMGLIILVGAGIYFYNYAIQKGANIGANLVISQIQTTSSIPVLIQEGNSTIVKWIPIQQICSS